MNNDVLLVVPSYTSYEMFLGGLPARAAASGLRVHLAAGPAIHDCRAESDRSLAGSVALPCIRGGDRIAAVRAVLALRRLVVSLRPRIIHAHFAAAAVITAATRYLAPRFNTTWMATFHGLSAGAPAGDATRVARWEAWAARRFDSAYVINVEDVALLRRLAPRTNVRLNASVTLGIDLDHFAPGRFDTAAREDIRRRLGIPRNAPVVTFVGRQVAFKGFGTAVRAFWRIRELVPDSILLLVGDYDAIHPSGLEPTEIQRLRDDATIIACGWQPDVSGHLAVSDAFLFPSQREGMPVCLMEALSMGVPCVTSDARGCRDLVRDGIDGRVIADQRPSAYAEATSQILLDPQLRASMRTFALEGRSRFDRRTFLDEQVRQYLDVINSSTKP